MSHHVPQENPFLNNSELTDLSWQPNNPYKYSIVESLLKKSYEICRPFVTWYSRLTGGNPVSALTNLSLNLLSYARGYNNNNTTLLWKQAVLETGAFTSIMSNSDNNQFGMHVPYTRPTTTASYRYNSSENSNVAIYNTIFDSVLDRMLWDDYNGIDPKESEYMNVVIDRDYNENPDTYDDLWSQAEMPRPPYVIFIWLAVVFAILYLIKKLIY